MKVEKVRCNNASKCTVGYCYHKQDHALACGGCDSLNPDHVQYPCTDKERNCNRERINVRCINDPIEEADKILNKGKR